MVAVYNVGINDDDDDDVVVDDKLQEGLEQLDLPDSLETLDNRVPRDYKDSRDLLVRKVDRVLSDNQVTREYLVLSASPVLLDRLDSQELLDRVDLLVTLELPVLRVNREIPELSAHRAALVSFIIYRPLKIMFDYFHQEILLSGVFVGSFTDLFVMLAVIS